MNPERMEDGVLLHKTLLTQTEDDKNGGKKSSTSSITTVVVLSTLFAVCGSFSYGLSMGYSSSSESRIMRELGLTMAEYSVFGSILTVGGAIGAVFSGTVASLIGRRQTLWFSQIFCIMGWLTIAFAQSAWWLDFGRFSLGIGVGFISYTVPVYIAEISPKNTRGAFVFVNQLMQNLGVSLAFSVGNFINWRFLAIIAAIPCIVSVIGLFFVPESPRWLAKVGRNVESKNVLQRLRGKNVDISQEESEIREIIETFDNGPKSGILDLFQRRYVLSLIVGIGLMLLQQLSGSSGIAFYANSIFDKAHFSSSVGTTSFALIMVPKTIVVLFLIDNWGRRPLLMVSVVGMCFSCFLVGLAFSFQAMNQFTNITPFLVFIGLLGYVTTYSLGLGGLPWVIMSEIYPNNVKVSAGSLVTFANWFTSWFITYTFNFMMAWNLPGTFYVFSIICGVGIAFVWMLVPETKGRTIEEIQVSLNSYD